MKTYHNLYYIYALIDPRNNIVHYIGISVDTQCRYYQHLHSGESPSILSWVKELKRGKMFPILQILETVKKDDNASHDDFMTAVYQREEYWIHEYLNSGAPLLNKSGVVKRYPQSYSSNISKPLREKIPVKKEEKQVRDEMIQAKTPTKKKERRNGYKTAQEIADELGVSIAKLRTIIARLNIQPRRFAGDLRKLYYSLEQVQEIRKELDLSSDVPSG